MVWYGIGICARLRLIGALVFVTGFRHSLFLTAETAAAVLYFVYTVFVHRPRVRLVLMAIFVSSAALFAAMLYRYLRRNQNYAHLRDDPRMLVAAGAHLVFALLLFPGVKIAPAWILELISLFTWMLLWACSGHDFLQRT
jgi:hypothetical protein